MGEDPLGAWLRGREAEAEDGAGDRGPGSRAAPRPDPAPGPIQGPDPWGLDLTGRAPRRLTVLAALPWVAAAALAVAVAVPALSPEPPPTPAPTPAGGPDLAADPPGTAATGTGAAGPAGAPAPAAPDADRAVRAVGELVVRAASGGTGDGDGVRYADHAVATGVERVGDLAVVRVAALVLSGRGDRWERAGLTWWAAPVRDGAGGPVPAGPPWPVPAPAGPAPAPDPDPDPALAAAVAAALDAAGYRDLADLRVARDPALAGTLRATVTARAPDGTVVPRDLLLADTAPPRLLGGSP